MNPISIRKLSLSFTSHSCPNADFRSGMRKIEHQRSVVDILPVLTANEASQSAPHPPENRQQATHAEAGQYVLVQPQLCSFPTALASCAALTPYYAYAPAPNLEVEQHNKAVGHQARKKYTMMSTPHGAAEKRTMFCMSRAIPPFHVQV